MKSKISNIYFLILGLLIFGMVSVSAAILLQPDEVSFISDKTSETTVKGALDELYELTKGECPVGHICTTCGVGTYANQEIGECITCPSGYTSDSGSGKITDCYIQTTAGKYIANANDSVQTTCPEGSYCPSTKVKYGSIGNIVTCPSGYTSAAGATSESQCYIQTTNGKWLSVAKGTTQETCPSGSYCVSTKVYYGNTGGKATCPSGKTSAAGATNCYTIGPTTYTKNGDNRFVGTYTCRNGVATLTSCSIEGIVCDGGLEGKTPTYMCTTYSYDYLYNACSDKFGTWTSIHKGGGLRSTESC